MSPRAERAAVKDAQRALARDDRRSVTCDLDGFATVLAYISANVGGDKGLAVEFFKARGQGELFGNRADPLDELKLWAERRFGRPLYEAELGVLWAAVRALLMEPPA